MAVEKMHLVNIMAKLENLDDFLEDLINIDEFDQVDALLSSLGSTETTRDEIGNLRSKAIELGRESGAPLKSEENVLRPPNDDSDLYLVGDIIALYW